MDWYQECTDRDLVAARRRSPVAYQALQARVRALHPLLNGCVAWRDPFTPGPTVMVPHVLLPGPLPEPVAAELAHALVAFAVLFRTDLPADPAGLLVPACVGVGAVADWVLQYAPASAGGEAVLACDLAARPAAKGPLPQVLARAAGVIDQHAPGT